MPLSWNEIRTRATAFVKEWSDAAVPPQAVSPSTCRESLNFELSSFNAELCELAGGHRLRQCRWATATDGFGCYRG